MRDLFLHIINIILINKDYLRFSNLPFFFLTIIFFPLHFSQLFYLKQIINRLINEFFGVNNFFFAVFIQ
ncbi:hypothetical protein SDC9_181898 [bioreactor metagenome]|uniref:Uncharacterized protein n=1 Tax=bioreactor metagenome TaxID=1076179 RepID=A0A645H5Z5_9ZZZZ